MKQLIENVVKWGADRGLDKVGHLAQAKYTLKETAELLDAYADHDIAKINDAIGDIFVTLIVGASNSKDTLSEFKYLLSCDDIGGLKPISQLYFSSIYIDLSTFALSLEHNIKSGIDLKESYKHCLYALVEAVGYANLNFNQSLSLKDCLQLAYDEIKNRNGKLVNGQFIKE